MALFVIAPEIPGFCPQNSQSKSRISQTGQYYILGKIIEESSPMHCRMCSSIFGLYQWGASCNSNPPDVTNQNISRYCQMSPGGMVVGRVAPGWRTTGLKPQQVSFFYQFLKTHRFWCGLGYVTTPLLILQWGGVIEYAGWFDLGLPSGARPICAIEPSEWEWG